MYYWNKDNFDGLKAVAEKYSEKENFKQFSEYCHYQEIGLRKKALQSIKCFVAHIDSLGFEKQKAIASEIIELQFFNGNIHQLSSHPLQQKLIAIFEYWCRENNAPADPFRWLGYLEQDTDLYEEALRRDSTDQVSINRLGNEYLYRVDNQMHHLGDSLFIGTFEEAETGLQKALNYIALIDSQDSKEQFKKEWEELQLLLGLFKKYDKEKSKLSFPDWSRIEGYDFGFPSTIYFGESLSE